MRKWVKRGGVVFLCCLTCLLAACQSTMRLADADQECTEEFFAMDTVVRITVYGERADEAVAVARERIMEYDGRFSVTNPTSEVSRLNGGNGEPVRVSDELVHVLNKAKSVSESSGGAFDVTIYPVAKAWGFYAAEGEERANRVPSSMELAEGLALVDYSNVVLDGNEVRLMNGSKVDLGGIAKGYISSLVMDELQGMGVVGAILSLGGNVETVGAKPDGSDWTVGVANPANPDGILGTVPCGETAVVTSGDYQRQFTEDGVTYHHVMDPATGYPANNGLSSVTVMCEDGMEADGLSTALFVMGLEGALAYWEEHKGFEAVFITDEAEVALTEGLKGKFTYYEE